MADISFQSPEEDPLANRSESDVHYQVGNEAVDIDRYTKNMVKGTLPPMNWWDMLPDWPAISYTSIIMDQTRAAKKNILEGLPSMDDVEFEIASYKFPYRDMSTSVLMKGKVDSSVYSTIVGHELLQKAEDKDTVADTKSVTATFPKAIITETTQVNAKYYPIAPKFDFPYVFRDDLTDQKNPALDLVDTQKLVDEFLDIGKRIYDQQTENPTIFGFDDVNSKYEKDKNIVLANYKQYKANVRRMEHLNNLVEANNNFEMTQNPFILYRHYMPIAAMTHEWASRYLREKLLAWYNEVDDPDTKIWHEQHWLPGDPGFIESLLEVGSYKWYNNLVAGMEDSVARLEDLEATIDLLSSMANALGTIEKYKTAIEMMELTVEQPDWDFENTVAFTHEIIDYTMLEDLLSVSQIKGDIDGELTPIRAELEGLRESNLSLLWEIRLCSPTTAAFPIIWTRLIKYVALVNIDISVYLNSLILDLRGDYETAGKHSSPSHLLLDISMQLTNIVDIVTRDTIDLINQQVNLPLIGFHRVDSMLNKVNEIRIHGPMCSIPWHYWMAIDNINAAERLYNDIWSDVFDCWEREYITRVWRVVTEHHDSGVIDPRHYGKPLFSAECPHHKALLHMPVPEDYRNIDICWLSANCRKDFNVMTNWITSVLYAIGVKRTAIGAVVTDTSLNGCDDNIEHLAELNVLETKNVIIKKMIDQAIKSYNGTKPLLPKMEFDKIIAAKELSPTHYSNQALLNMSSQVDLLNTFPVTALKVATNENRTGTVVSDSPPLQWMSQSVPQVSDVEVQGDKSIVTDELIVNTIPTVGGPSEIVIDTHTMADMSIATKSFYVGDVDEFEPWKYMTPDWFTQRALKEIPITPIPEAPPVVPSPPEIQLPSVPSTEPTADVSVPLSSAPAPRGAAQDLTQRLARPNVTMQQEAQAKAAGMDALLMSIVQGLANNEFTTRGKAHDKPQE